MTEPMPDDVDVVETTQATTTKKKRRLFLPVAAAIIVIAVAGFIVSRAGLDKALVKQMIDNVALQVKEKGRAQGRDVNLAYGELEVVGSFSSKHVVVHDVVLTVAPLERSPAQIADQKSIDALRFTTASVSIYPESVDLSTLRIEAAEPIDVAAVNAPEKSLLNIKSDTPTRVTVSRKKLDGAETIELGYNAPTKTLITYLREEQAAGAEDATPSIVPVYKTLQLEMAQGSGYNSTLATDDSGLGEAKLFLRDLVITQQEAPESAINIAEITGYWGNTLNAKKLNALHVSLTFGPVTSANTALPHLPIALDMDATYEGMLSKSPQSIAQVESQESTMVLKTFKLTSKDASVNASANFTASAADVLPVGTANIALTNLPFVLTQLRQYGVMHAGNEPVIASVLQQITGTELAQITDLTIPVERLRGGAFKIGNATFEELFALFLKQAMQNKAPAAAEPLSPTSENGARPLVPTLPPADKPKLAPIPVPDSSVRG